MKTLRFAASMTAALLFGTSAAMAACEVSFNDDIQPLFTKRCAACHNNASPGEGMTLQKDASYANLVNTPSTQVPEMMRVVPGDAAASYLAHKLQDTHLDVGGSGAKMPLSGRLKEEDVAAILSWITDCDAAQ